jgi:hypothetical protein
MTRILLLAAGLLAAHNALAQCTVISLPDLTSDTQFSEDAEPYVSRKFYYPASNPWFEDDLVEFTLRKISGPDDWNYQLCESEILDPPGFCRPINFWETEFTIIDTVYSEQETEYDVEFIARSYGTGLLELTIVRSVCPDDTINQILSFTLEQGSTVAPLPLRPQLAGNWPNPFNPVTQIPFRLEAGGVVSVEVHDLLGRLVARPLADAALSAGDHAVRFDGAGLPSGVYLYSVVTPRGSSSAAMTLLK